ncbi:MAG: hypothetical protein VB124_01545, partial [Burkholderia sp.]
LLEAKNRELSQEPELLTGVLDWLLGINVNRSLARPIYATTPIEGTPSRHRATARPDQRGLALGFVAVLLLKFVHRQTGLKLDSVHGHSARSVSIWRPILDFTPASESSN